MKAASYPARSPAAPSSVRLRSTRFGGQTPIKQMTYFIRSGMIVFMPSLVT